MDTSPANPAPHHIALVYHEGIADAEPIAREMAAYIHSCAGTREADLFSQKDPDYIENLGRYDLAIALGGDGTILRVSHVCARKNIPVLGVNLGRLGFLAELQRGDWKPGLEQICRGEYWFEHRMMLHVKQERAEKTLGEWDVLNECVVARGGGMKLVQLETSVDGQPLTTYAADGLIAATPTGSTAYALAAGGPILPPEMHAILLVPVAPHLSVERAVVLPEGAEVVIRVHTESPAVLSCDGHHHSEVLTGDRVSIQASDRSVKFVRVQGRGYFYRNITTRLNRNPQAGG
jgi:NAD+ kinase